MKLTMCVISPMLTTRFSSVPMKTVKVLMRLTERMIAAMHEDEARLYVQRPDHEPRATRHIDDIIVMIETLIEKGFAYAADNGDVYYRVRRFEGYGKLNNRNLDDMRSGARVEVDTSKEDPLDFVLWKAAKPGEASLAFALG